MIIQKHAHIDMIMAHGRGRQLHLRHEGEEGSEHTGSGVGGRHRYTQNGGNGLIKTDYFPSCSRLQSLG